MAQEASLADFMEFADSAGGIQTEGAMYDPFEEEEQEDQYEDQDDQEEENDEEQEEQEEQEEEQEEQEEEEEEESEEESEEEEEEGNFNKQAVSALYDQLVSEGVIQVSKDFKFDGTAAGLDQALDQTFEQLSNSAKNTLIESLPAEVGLLVNYSLQTGGTIKDFMENQGVSNSLENLDIDDESNQEEVLRQFYKSTTKYSDDRIERLVSQARKSGDLSNEAQNAYRDLLNLEQENKNSLEQRLEEQKQRQLEAEKKERETFETIIENSENIDKVRKSRLRNFVVNKSRKRGESNHSTELKRTLTLLSQNPDHIIQLGDLLLDYNPQKGINLERLQDKTNSKRTKDTLSRLDKALDPTAKTSGGSTSFDRKKRKDFNWEMWADQANLGGVTAKR